MNPDMHPQARESFDASDAKQVREREQRAIRREKESREVVATLLSTPAGRNWMWQLLEAAHCFELSFSPDSQSVTAFREGERNIGLSLIAQITRTAPESFIQMMRENGNG